MNESWYRYDFRDEVQALLVSIVFLALGIGNIVTTIKTIFVKKNRPNFKYAERISNKKPKDQ